MKCQILFSGKNKKNNIILSSAENAQRVVKVKLSPPASSPGVMINPHWLGLLISSTNFYGPKHVRAIGSTVCVAGNVSRTKGEDRVLH